jgi:small-conductance mechanosensitive channel
MKKYFIALFLALLSVVAYASAQTSAPVNASAQVTAAPVETATLVLFSRPVFTFRAPNHGISTRDRVRRAQTRIQEQLAIAGPHRVTYHADGVGIQVRIDGASSFFITPEDLDPGSEEGLEQTAQRVTGALTLAIKESMESRSLDTMIRALVSALVASALCAVVVWLMAIARRRIADRLIAVTETHSEKLHVGGVTLFRRERLAKIVQMGLTVLYRVLVLVLSIEWLSYVLRAFPFTRAWGESLNSFILELATPVFTSAMGAVPELVTAALIFYICYLLTQALDRFFANVQSGQFHLHWLDADIAVPTQRITKVVLWLFALAMAYPYLPGSDTEAFKGLSVLAGLMLSMGASSLVGQAASGLILTYGRAFRRGEYVRIAEHEGTVMEMGMFTTRLRTGLGEELTISNASILGSTTKNYSRAVQGQGFVIDTTVTIGYDTPWRQVHAMLIEAAKRTPGVLHEPSPQVSQTSLTDFYPVYRLVCQGIPEGPRPRAQLLSNLHANIQDSFNEYGVQILSPHYRADPHVPKTVPPARWYAAPAEPPQSVIPKDNS